MRSETLHFALWPFLALITSFTPCCAQSVGCRLQQETERVESVLLMPRSVQALYRLFKSTQLVTFTSILQSFIGLPARSARLAVCFAEHEQFLKELVRRLQLDEVSGDELLLLLLR